MLSNNLIRIDFIQNGVQYFQFILTGIHYGVYSIYNEIRFVSIHSKKSDCFYSPQKIRFGLISVLIILSINYSKIKWNCIALHSAPTWINVCNIYDQSTASHVISNWYKANTVGYLFVSLFWWFVYCNFWFECLDVIKHLIRIKRHTLIKRHAYRIFDFVMNKKKVWNIVRSKTV